MTPLTLEELPLPGLVVGHERLGDRVWRVRLDQSAPVRTLIAKCLKPEVSTRVRMIAHRWLPAVGLASAGPPLRRVIPAPSAGMIWHLYDDLGDWALGESGDDEERLRALVVLIARLHESFASHLLLGEIRQQARDLRADVHVSTLQGVVRALGRVRPDTSDQRALLDRLSVRFGSFLEEAPVRAAVLRELGGPETLVHGDLWPKNGVVVPDPSGARARLIDWDRAGVGSAVYDLSTLLSRLPVGIRTRVLDWYREASEPPVRPSSRDELNLLAETCERTRLSEWSFWRVLAIDSPDADWAWQEIARVEPWLDVPPLFPDGFETR